MYKLLAVDMDGTLLNSKGELTEKNKNALKAAMSKGVKVVITSGRAIHSIKRFLIEAGLTGENDYAITYNGGAVYNLKNFECIAYKGITGRNLFEIKELCESLDMKMIAYDWNYSLAEEENEYTIFEREHIGSPVKLVSYKEYVKEDDEIIKVILFDNPDALDEKMKKIPQEFYENYNIVKSLPWVLEILPKECNKGYGLEIMAKQLNIKREEIISIGDQANDLEMIEFAGLGVAMGNAIEEVKNIASYVTTDNDNDGVAAVVEKFILSER